MTRAEAIALIRTAYETFIDEYAGGTDAETLLRAQCDEALRTLGATADELSNSPISDAQ